MGNEERMASWKEVGGSDSMRRMGGKRSWHITRSKGFLLYTTRAASGNGIENAFIFNDPMTGGERVLNI
jgi:hypothetical protein